MRPWPVMKPSPGTCCVGHAEVRRARGDELAGLLEAALIEQEVDALAREQLAGFLFAGAAFGAAAGLGFGVALGQFGEAGFVVDLFSGIGCDSS